MTTITETDKSRWDLSHALNFVNTLASVNDELKSYTESSLHLQAELNSGDGVGLGDFSRVWQFLGTPVHTSELPTAPSKEDYASDGATYKRKARTKKAPSIVTDAEDLTASASDTPTLTKTQRKRLRRKERKAAEESQKTQRAGVSESEAEFASRKTPARKASAHVQSKLTALQDAKNVTREIKRTKQQGLAKKPEVVSGMHANHTPDLDHTISDEDAVNAVAKAAAQLKQAGGQLPSTPTRNARTVPRYDIGISNTAVHFTPSSVQPPPNGKSFNPSAVKLPTMPAAQAVSVSQYKTNPPAVIQPAIVRSGEDRQWALFLKILNDFSDDRKFLVAPMNMTTHNNDPKGIHVFVDASNIFIGFMDQLKRSRNIHPLVKVPQVDLSFDALALLMERRRPVAKRVLAGSTPHIAAFDVAKAVGYECSILEKVYKARELTERQIYFQELDARRNGKTPKRAPISNTVFGSNSNSPFASRTGDVGGNGSGSETNAPQYAPPKMIEQGVDEILHLKILESVVDSEEPSTIVLATGDAAAAEYSDGFMAMASRALKKGWKVELVSWSKNISGMYKRQQWTDAWGDRFRIIYLDDYAEELLDM